MTWWSKGKLEAAGKGPTPEEIRAEELRRVKVLCQSIHGAREGDGGGGEVVELLLGGVQCYG